MILYHGTDQRIDVIDLSKSRLRTDFGRGFYLSDRLGNARTWAVDKSGNWGVPTVIRCYVDDAIWNDVGLQHRKFDSPTAAWLNFVRDNRRRNSAGVSSNEPRHSFDIISGPIADDKVALAVDKYCRGLLTTEEAIEEIRIIKEVFQVSLHTPLALTYIRQMLYSQRTNKRWSGWQETSSQHPFLRLP